MLTSHTHNSKSLWLLAMASVVGLFIIYGSTLSYPFLTQYDDGPLIQENIAVLHFDLKTIWSEYVFGLYHPITSTLFAIEWKLFSGNSMGFRWVSLVLHLLNGLLVYQLSKRLKFSGITSAFISFVFVVHPMHIESVVWLSEQKDLLYSLFFLLGLVHYLNYLASEKSKWLAGSLAFFILSVLSKSAAVVFPLLLVAILWYYQKISVKNILVLLPFFIISFVIGLVHLNAQQQAEIINTYPYSALQRMLLFTYSLVYYWVSLIIPWNLSPKHFYPNFSEGIPILFGLFFALAAGFTALLFYFRKNKWILFSQLFYFVTIALVLKIITTGNDLVSDRYSYLPHVAVLWMVFYFLEQLNFKKWVAIVSLVSIGYILVGKHYVNTWKSEIELWSSVVKDYPNHSIGYAERGRNYLERKQYQLAIKDILRSHQLDSSNKHVKNYLGLTYEAINKPEKAFLTYTQAIELDSAFGEAWNNRGVLLGKYGKTEASISDLETALKLDEKNADTYNNLGIAYAQLGDFKKAKLYFEQCLKLNPNHPDARKNLQRLQTQ